METAQRYLIDEEGLDITSPKGCIRASRKTGLLNEAQTSLALKMTDARNLTSHTYNEGIPPHLSRLGELQRAPRGLAGRGRGRASGAGA